MAHLLMTIPDDYTMKEFEKAVYDHARRSNSWEKPVLEAFIKAYADSPQKWSKIRTAMQKILPAQDLPTEAAVGSLGKKVLKKIWVQKGYQEQNVEINDQEQKEEEQKEEEQKQEERKVEQAEKPEEEKLDYKEEVKDNEQENNPESEDSKLIEKLKMELSTYKSLLRERDKTIIELNIKLKEKEAHIGFFELSQFDQYDLENSMRKSKNFNERALRAKNREEIDPFENRRKLKAKVLKPGNKNPFLKQENCPKNKENRPETQESQQRRSVAFGKAFIKPH